MVGLARASAFAVVLASVLAGAPIKYIVAARAIDNLSIERLAICQDSWIDWKDNDPTKLSQFVQYFRSGFRHSDSGGFFVPTSAQTAVGLPVTRVYPESVGMGVGFSVWVTASFDQARTALERKIGKPLRQCETGDNMRICSLELSKKKTVALEAENNPKSMTTLIGCFYFYEK